jgi:hypothetical protein
MLRCFMLTPRPEFEVRVAIDSSKPAYPPLAGPSGHRAGRRPPDFASFDVRGW